MNHLRFLIVLLVLICFFIESDADSNRFELKLTSPVLRVATTPQIEDIPSAAFNSSMNQFFVVWAHRICDSKSGCHANVRGKFINTDGSMSGERTYSSLLKDGEVFQTQIAYNSRLNNYLLTWFGEIGTSAGLFSRVISANGNPGVRQFTLSTSSDDSIAYQPTTNQYLVSSSGYLRISSQGQAIGEPVKPTGADFFPMIFPDISGGFTVLAERNRRTITLQKISQNGQLLGSAVKAFSKKGNDFELFSAAYNPQRNQYLVTVGGALTSSGRRQIKAFVLDNSGKLSSPPRIIAVKTAESFTITRNAIVFSDRAYLVAYLKDGHLWIRPVDVLGRPVGKEIKITEDIATHVEASILYDSTAGKTLVIWQRALGQSLNVHARFVEWAN